MVNIMQDFIYRLIAIFRLLSYTTAYYLIIYRVVWQ